MSLRHAAVLLLFAAACVDTKARFDAFNERYDDYKKRLEDERDAGRDDDAGECQPVTPEQLEGRYLYAFAGAFDKTKPILMSLEIKARKGNDSELDVTLHALSVEKLEPVGKDIETTLVLDGKRFSVDVTLLVAGAANPLLPGVDASADVTLTGEVCSPSEGDVVDFLCGDATGAITNPLEIPLEGSEFGALRVEEGDAWPEPVSTCAMGDERP